MLLNKTETQFSSLQKTEQNIYTSFIQQMLPPKSAGQDLSEPGEQEMTQNLFNTEKSAEFVWCLGVLDPATPQNMTDKQIESLQMYK